MSERINHLLIRIVPILLILFILVACSGAASPDISESEYGFAEAPAAAEDRSASGEELASYESQDAQSFERIVIKNASLSLVVNDPSVSMDAIAQMAEEMGGFVVSANLYQTELDSGVKVPRASIMIRIPAERLNEALERIQEESTQEPLNQTIESQDVTREYTDLQSRLTNLEIAEAQLQEIMDQAAKTEDVLNVYNQLVRVREEIEVIKGQIKYYEQSAALSAIQVELLPDEAVQPLTIGGWQPVGVAKSAVQALINALKFLGNLLIWVLIVFLPVALILYVIMYLPLRFIWRRVRRRRVSTEEVTVATGEQKAES